MGRKCGGGRQIGCPCSVPRHHYWVVIVADVFSGLNATCVSVFGESVDYTIMSTGTLKSISGIVEMDTEEEQHADAVYVRMFYNILDLGQKPDHGDNVYIPEGASPLNNMGAPRALPLGSSWTVYESLVDPVGGAYVRLRQDI